MPHVVHLGWESGSGLSSAPWGAATATPPPPRQTDTARSRRTSPAATKCKFPTESSAVRASLRCPHPPEKKKKKLARNLVIFSTFREATHGMFRQITVRACACALHICTMASVKVGSAPPNHPHLPTPGRAAQREMRVDEKNRRHKSAPRNDRTTLSSPPPLPGACCCC